MQIAPTSVAARRMALLLFAVTAIDATVAFFAAYPRFWCAVIPALIPLLTPAVLFVPFKRRTN